MEKKKGESILLVNSFFSSLKEKFPPLHSPPFPFRRSFRDGYLFPLVFSKAFGQHCVFFFFPTPCLLMSAARRSAYSFIFSLCLLVIFAGKRSFWNRMKTRHTPSKYSHLTLRVHWSVFRSNATKSMKGVPKNLRTNMEDMKKVEMMQTTKKKPRMKATSYHPKHILCSNLFPLHYHSEHDSISE